MNRKRTPLHTFVVRCLVTEPNQVLGGQVSEPASPDEWQARFTTADECLALILARTTSLTSIQLSKPNEDHNEP